MARYLLLRFSSLGDVVLASAAARHIKRSRPGAWVALATKAAYAELLAGCPDLDEVWPLEAAGLAGLARRARRARLNAVLDLHANLRSRALGLACGAPVFRWRARGLERRLRVLRSSYRPPEPGPVALRYAAAAAAALGEAAPREAPRPRLSVDAAAGDWAQAWLAERGVAAGQRLLAVAPGAAWPSKRWGAEHLAQCLDLVSEFDKVRFLFVGSSAESPLVEAVQGFQRKSRALSLRADGQTGDLRRLAALLGRCRRLLGHDSGTLHLAEALGLPATALYGPTVRAFGFYPLDPASAVFERELACRPCSLHGSKRCPLGHHDCMQSIEPFEVAAQLRRALGLEAAA